MLWQNASHKNFAELVYQSEQLRARNVLNQHDFFQVMAAMKVLCQPANLMCVGERGGGINVDQFYHSIRVTLL